VILVAGLLSCTAAGWSLEVAKGADWIGDADVPTRDDWSSCNLKLQVGGLMDYGKWALPSRLGLLMVFYIWTSLD